MKANNNRYWMGAAIIASIAIFSCNNSSDYKNYNDSDAKQNAAIEQSNVDTNAMNIGTTPALSPDVTGTDTTASTAATTAKNTTTPAHKKGTRTTAIKRKGVVRLASYSPAYQARLKEDNQQYAGNGTYYGPAFPGGEKQLAQYIQDKLEYPQDAIDNGVEGTIDVHFAVDENGNIYQPMIKGDKLGYGLDDEAVQVVKSMPKWVPGKLKGKNVKTYYDLPITFTLL